MLFLVALCAVYRLEQWKQLLILVTAFTVGHSITLGLTSLSLLTIPSDLIEFLIPATISITALHNVLSDRQTMQSERRDKTTTSEPQLSVDNLMGKLLSGDTLTTEELMQLQSME